MSITSVQQIRVVFYKKCCVSVQHNLLVRHAHNLTKRITKQEERKNNVFQYAGKNLQRAERIYAWGRASTGALGRLRTDGIARYKVIFINAAVLSNYYSMF